MRKVVEEHVRAKRREQAERRRIAQFEKVRARVEAARTLLPSASEALQAVPHPDAYYAQQGKSRLDWVRYLLENAGTAGQEVACGWIERAARGEL
jgi:hypothetical protein